jgi:hypothetical protein
MKVKELIFALVPKSAARAGKLLETQGLHFGVVRKSAEVPEKGRVGDFLTEKECVSQWKQRTDFGALARLDDCE